MANLLRMIAMSSEIEEITKRKRLLRHLRRAAGMSQGELALATGMSSASIAKIDSEKWDKNPSESSVREILKVYGLSTEDLLNAVSEIKLGDEKTDDSIGRHNAALAESLIERGKKIKSEIESEIEGYDVTDLDEASFFSTVFKYAGKLPLISDALAAYFAFKDPKTDTVKRVALLSALTYFFNPFDVIPDITPIVGFTDDVAVLGAAMAFAGTAVTALHRSKAKEFLLKLREPDSDTRRNQ